MSGERQVWWSKPDSIRINGKRYDVDSITPTDSTRAVFIPSGTPADKLGGVYKAYYPASYWKGSTLVLPEKQQYEAPVTVSGQKYPKIAHLPMYAESETRELEFYNLCTVLNVRLAGSASNRVDSVVVTSATKKLNGPFDVVADGTEGFKAQMKSGTAAPEEKKVTLDCGGVELDPNIMTEFCIAIPAGDYPQYDLTIKVYNGDTEIASFTNLDAGTSNLGSSKMLDLEKPVTMSFSIRTPNNNYELALPFVANAKLSSDVEVDWGDRGPTDPPDTYYSGSNANLMKHVYATAGDYDVTLKFLAFDATMPEMVFSNTNFRQVLTALTSPLPLMTNAAGSAVVTDASQMFTHCSALTAIHPDLFINNPQLANFYCTFYKCSSLTAIPETLFAPCQNATNFHGTFSGCSSLAGGIPENLFANNTKVTTFEKTFENCSSLTGGIGALFVNHPEAKIFNHTFYGCSSLDGTISENLFAGCPEAGEFLGVFENCHKLKGPIPPKLFANNPKATYFRAVFLRCTKLEGTIPPELFANNTKAASFMDCFGYCENLEGKIPEELFANCPDVTNFYGVFASCLKLEGPIPENLFANNPNVESFGYAFYKTFHRNNSNPGGNLPPGLFANNPKAKNFSFTFGSCHTLEGEIPGGFFANQRLENTSYLFVYTFNACRHLKLNPRVFLHETETETPYDRFNKPGMTVDLRGCFSYVGTDRTDPDMGVAPKLWDPLEYRYNDYRDPHSSSHNMDDSLGVVYSKQKIAKADSLFLQGYYGRICEIESVKPYPNPLFWNSARLASPFSGVRASNYYDIPYRWALPVPVSNQQEGDN